MAIGAVLAVLGVSEGLAADIAVPPNRQVAEPAWSWTGFYIGGHGGYGWGLDPFKETVTGPGQVPSTLSDIKSRGYVAGGHAGYNWQHGMVVGGLELDLDATGIKGSRSSVVTQFGATFTTRDVEKFNYLGTARARVGFVPWQSVMFYGTGGLAWTQINFDTSQTFVAPGQGGTFRNAALTTMFGVVAGAGAEMSLGNFGMGALLLRVEYLHYDFGDLGSSFNSNTFQGVTTTITDKRGHLTADVVRGGASLKF
jgi:outer membrane immunogenic protein